MTNVQWRVFRGKSLALINEMQEQELPTEFEEELERIINLLEHEDEIDSYPKVLAEAPTKEFNGLPKEVKEKYRFLLKEAQRFRPLN